jgi:hypothetical protein
VIRFIKNQPLSFDIKALDLLIEDYPIDVDAHPYNKQIEDLSVGTFGKVWRENFPKEIVQYIEEVGLERNQFHSYINVQLPGKMTTLHQDNHNYASNKLGVGIKDLRRLLIFLTDWNKGETFCVEDECLVNWKQGDCYTFDTMDWHWGVNAGYKTKYTLILSIPKEFMENV